MTNNGSNAVPAAKPYERVPDEMMRNADLIKNAAMYLVQDLHAAGRADLTPPFLDVLKALANVDYAALQRLDEQTEQGAGR